MITGCDNYTYAVEFAGPQYLPVSLGCVIDWMYEKDEKKCEKIRELQGQFRDDLCSDLWCWKNMKDSTLFVDDEGTRHWVDEWGVEWIDDGHGARTKSHPLEEGYSMLDSYKFPDPERPDRFTEEDKLLSKRGDRYVLATVWFTLFERLWMLRGFNNMLMDPYINKGDFLKLRDKVLELDLMMVDEWLKRGVNGIFFSDDWGSQKGLLINPSDWRKFYKPSYEVLFERVRSGGAHVWMHLCGDISAILPDLIDIGLNVLNPVQPQAMDVRMLSREFGGKVCFFGGVDVQGTLIKASPNQVKKEVDFLVQLFGSYNGGYIGSTSHSIMPETPLDNVIALYEAFLQYHT